MTTRNRNTTVVTVTAPATTHQKRLLTPVLILTISVATVAMTFVSANLHAATLVGHWKLEETSTAQGAVDSSGTKPDGVYAAGVDPNVSGPTGFGSAAEFFGNGSDINIGAGINFTNNFSVTAWVNFNDLSQHNIIGNATGSAFRNSGNKLQFTNFGKQDYTSTGTLTAGVWTHVAAVVDANNDGQLYINGVDAGLVPHNAAGNGSNAPYAIGALGPGNTSNGMVGLIDDVRIYDGSLTQNEVIDIMTPPPVIPEPSSLVLATLGSLGLLGWGRRRRR